MPIAWDRSKAEQLVQQLYHHLFGREPELEIARGLVAGFAEGWLSARIQLMTMLKSEEFFDKRLRGMTPQQMALILYRFILAREPDSSEDLQGAADFVGNLGWRVQVDTMINSEEYIGRYGDDILPDWKLEKPSDGSVPDEDVPVGVSRRPATSFRAVALPRPPVGARTPWHA